MPLPAWATSELSISSCAIRSAPPSGTIRSRLGPTSANLPDAQRWVNWISATRAMVRSEGAAACTFIGRLNMRLRSASQPLRANR